MPHVQTFRAGGGEPFGRGRIFRVQGTTGGGGASGAQPPRTGGGQSRTITKTLTPRQQAIEAKAAARKAAIISGQPQPQTRTRRRNVSQFGAPIASIPGGTILGRSQRGGGSAQSLKLLQKELERLRQATGKRFRQVRGRAEETTERVRGLFGEARQQIAGVGGVAREEIERQRQREQASGLQSLRARGLAGTTLQENLGRGVAEDESRRLRALAEQQSRLQAGVSQRFAGAEQQLGQLGIDVLGSPLRQAQTQQQRFLDLLSQMAIGGL